MFYIKPNNMKAGTSEGSIETIHALLSVLHFSPDLFAWFVKKNKKQNINRFNFHSFQKYSAFH